VGAALVGEAGRPASPLAVGEEETADDDCIETWQQASLSTQCSMPPAEREALRRARAWARARGQGRGRDKGKDKGRVRGRARETGSGAGAGLPALGAHDRRGAGRGPSGAFGGRGPGY